jgi:hypothetical protein
LEIFHSNKNKQANHKYPHQNWVVDLLLFGITIPVVLLQIPSILDFSGDGQLAHQPHTLSDIIIEIVVTFNEIRAKSNRKETKKTIVMFYKKGSVQKI